MLTEIACYDQDSTFSDILETVFVASQYDANVVIPSGFMPKVDGFLKDHTFAAAIDYPYGINRTQVRIHEIILAIRQGASTIDLTLNPSNIVERNWVKVKEDLQNCLAVCKQNNIELRPIIEYRLFDKKTVMELCSLIKRVGLYKIINSTGYMVDDFQDNALTTFEIQRDTDLSVIYCGPVRTNEHYDILKQMNIHAIRFTSPKLAEIILSNGV